MARYYLAASICVITWKLSHFAFCSDLRSGIIYSFYSCEYAFIIAFVIIQEMGTAKPIRLSGHAKEQLVFRGTSEKEVIETIMTAQWQPAELGRLECKKDFIFENEWNKRYYKTKQVRPIFADEDDEIVVVTIYTYFF